MVVCALQMLFWKSASLIKRLYKLGLWYSDAVTESDVMILKWSLFPQICRPNWTSIAVVSKGKCYLLGGFCKVARTQGNSAALPPVESYIMTATGWTLRWCSQILITSTNLFCGSSMFSLWRWKCSGKSAKNETSRAIWIGGLSKLHMTWIPSAPTY